MLLLRTGCNAETSLPRAVRHLRTFFDLLDSRSSQVVHEIRVLLHLNIEFPLGKEYFNVLTDGLNASRTLLWSFQLRSLLADPQCAAELAHGISMFKSLINPDLQISFSFTLQSLSGFPFIGHSGDFCDCLLLSLPVIGEVE